MKTKKVEIKQLWVGDRFRAYDQLWTVIQPEGQNRIARQHPEAEQKLGAKGFGYIGSVICTFEAWVKVEYVPTQV